MQPIEVIDSLHRGQDDVDREQQIKETHRILYFSHFISEFSNQAWNFSVILFLAAIQDFESLFLVSCYGITVGLAVVMVGPWASRSVVDEVHEWNRLSILQILICTQNLATLVECALCYVLLLRNSTPETVVHDQLVWLVLLMLAGSCTMVLSSTITVVLERDWLIVMAGNGDGVELLSSMNVTMRQIDLTCRIVAPAVAGFLVGPVPMTVAVAVVGSFSVISLLVESACAVVIYNRVPGLRVRGGVCDHATQDQEEDIVAVPVVVQSSLCWMIPRGFYVYMQQRPVCYAGIALALLYLNTLSFGTIMTAYLFSRGMQLTMVGIWRGIASAVGLLGTLVYRQQASVVYQGLWSIWYQLLCVTISFFAVFLLGESSTDSSTCLIFLIGGVVLSRVGLWVFDIAVTQLMQQYIPESYRGSVGGTQQALNSAFELVAFGLGILWPNPSEFVWLVAFGYAALVVAALLYTLGLVRNEDKLATWQSVPSA